MIYEIGGKHFTTLRDIADMTRACGVAAPQKSYAKSCVRPTPDTTRALEAARDAFGKL
jgi:hypothetical protein